MFEVLGEKLQALEILGANSRLGNGRRKGKRGQIFSVQSDLKY